jgi:hypothetical protein
MPVFTRPPYGAGKGPYSGSVPLWEQLYHPWTSYVIVPLFVLANASVSPSGSPVELAVDGTTKGSGDEYRGSTGATSKIMSNACQNSGCPRRSPK